MKKTIISIIGIAVMLLAITACRPNYVIVPIPGGGTSSTPSGTPVADLDELQKVLADGGEARLTGTLKLNPKDLVNLSGKINGNDNTIELQTTESVGDEQAVALILKNGLSLKNVKIDASNAAQTRVAAEPFVILIQGEGSTLENVTITTGEELAGINVHTATGVTLRNIKFIDKPLKAPINISSSTVIIDGLTAVGSDWYGEQNIIQINGVGGSPAHKASTVTFASTKGIDGVWMEAVEATYVNDETISDKDFRQDGQSDVKGLSSDWAIRYSNQPSKKTEGWMFYAPDHDASTFILNEKAINPEEDLRAMIKAVKDSTTRKYSAIQLSEDVELAQHLDVNTSVTIKGAGHTIKPANDFQKGPNDEFVLISADGIELENVIVDGINTTTGTKPSGWDGEYAIRVYAPDTKNQIKVTFEDVTIKDADVGMLVRGGNVTLKGNINFENLDWGGIGVDSIGQDTSLVYNSTVDALGCKKISYTKTGEEKVVKPAIWKERTNVNETVETTLREISKKEAGSESKDYQTWYVTDNFDGGTTESGSEEISQ